MCYGYRNLTPPPSVFGSQIKYFFMKRQVPVTRNWLCSSSSQFSSSGPGCYCDKECILFGDCCIDAFNTTEGLRVDIRDMEDALQEPVKLYEDIRKTSLETLYLNIFNAYSSCHRLDINKSDINIVLIDRCPVENPEGVDSVILKKCENSTTEVLSSIPVTLEFSVNWQIAFRNIFCALCHGFEKEDIIIWNVHADCRGNVTVTTKNIERIVSDSCVTVYTPPVHAGKLRQCYMVSELKSKCLAGPNNTTDSIACQVYLAPVVVSSQIYKNVHCAYCLTNVSRHDFIHAVGNVNQAISMSKTPPQAQSGFGPPGMIPTPYPGPSMRVLFDFTYQAGLAFSADGSSKYDKTKRCKDDEIYDFVFDTCKTVVCPKDLVYEKERCQYENLIFNAEENILPITTECDDGLIVSITSQNCAGASENETIISQRYKETLDEVLIKYVNKNQRDSNSTVKALASASDDFHQPTQSVIENAILVSYLHIRSDEILDLADTIKAIKKFTRLISRSSLPGSIKVLNVTLSNRKFNNKFKCPDNRHVAHSKGLTIDTINDTVYFIDRQLKVANKALNTIFSLDFVPGSSKTLVLDAVICSKLVCPQVELSEEEYTFQNATLKMVETGKLLTSKEFEMRNNSVYVCIHTGRGKIPKALNFDMPNAILIIPVTYSLSIAALFLTILIYVKYVSMRTLHGKTLVSLSASLIGAQLTELLPIETCTIWCRLAAVVSHFSWLSAFGWMSMISYNMATTFFGKQTTVTNTHVDRKRYFMYSLIGWLLPGLIVITCIVLDNLNVPLVVQVGYGEGFTGCFISGKGIFIFFSLPNLISVLFNTIAFFLTVYGITSKRKVVPSSKRRSRDRWFFLIYVKLSVVMGVAWLLAILASITHQLFLWYIHFVLNGLQGVFIFISFALRATIWKKIRMKKLKKPNKLPFLSKKASLYSVSGNSVTLP